MNRAELQLLADLRALDAEALLVAGRWSGAYYLAGYAVECGLKACIAKLTNQYDFPDKEVTLKAYTHRIEELVIVAQLTVPRNAAMAANKTFNSNWLVVKDWNEHARYKQWSELQARALFQAVTDTKDGVLPWIMGHW